MKNIDWNKVEEPSEFPRLEAGGYLCVITKVTDMPEKEYLRIEYDIAEGEHRDHYRSLSEAMGFWGGRFNKSYKETARRYFKAFITAIEKSNPRYSFKNDEESLIGKKVGLVLAKEEYLKNDNSMGERLYVESVRSIEAIRTGDYKIPTLRPYKEPADHAGTAARHPSSTAPGMDGFINIPDGIEEDLPFL